MKKILGSKIVVFICTFLLLATLIIKFTKPYQNENLLNYFAKFYFDEQYYTTQYPEILEQNVDPFEHYISTGWKEGKNPNPEFDSNLYSNLYLLHNCKHKFNPLAHYFYSLISFKSRFTNKTQLKKVHPLKNPQYYLALTAIFRNDAPFLKEWIEFYRLLGVEHFYLHNHLSQDNFAEILEPYINEGIVTVYNITEEAKDTPHWNNIQNSAYFSTIQKIQDNVEWLMILDTDEFLFPVQEQNLAKVLKEYDAYPGLAVNWRIYGSSNIKKIPSDKLLIETLVKRNATKDFQVKSIIKPRYVERIYNPHFPKFKHGYEKVNENFEYFSGPFAPYESRKIFRINHYWSRDLDFFHSRKVAREHVINNHLSEDQVKSRVELLLKQDKDNSSVYDGSILKYVDEMRTRIFHNESDPS